MNNLIISVYIWVCLLSMKEIKLPIPTDQHKRKDTQSKSTQLDKTPTPSNKTFEAISNMASDSHTPVERIRYLEVWQRAAERVAAGGTFNPCIIYTDLYGLCGHFVYTTSCNDPSKVLVDGELQDASTACDNTCQIQQLTPWVYEQVSCDWCRHWPLQPITTSNRSDPGVDILSPDEVDERRNEHMLPPLPSIDREELETKHERYLVLGIVRRTRQRRIEGIQRQNQVPIADRLYFYGPGYDDRALLALVTDFDSIVGDMTCSICRSTVDFRAQSRDVVQLPCRHAWHRRCLIPWFQDNDAGSCPACRTLYQLAGDETDVDESGKRIS